MSSQPDLSQLTPQELKLYKMYGKLPSRNEVLAHKLQERKYFDSGDYALNKAGVKSDNILASPENPIPGSGLRQSLAQRRMSATGGSVPPPNTNELINHPERFLRSRASISGASVPNPGIVKSGLERDATNDE